jgi:hypothetical protein
MDPYITWLQKRSALFEAGGAWWTPYHKALVPASAKPEPVDLELPQAKDLLRKSGTFFLRYFTRTFEEPTDFWYTACNSYEIANLSRHTRYEIRRAHKGCVVRLTDPVWLAANGYECYAAAFARYRNQRAESTKHFQENLLGDVGGPFEFWAVFIQEKLAGYAKCVVGNDYAVTVVCKLHPDYLSFYPAYALVDSMLRVYVTDGHKTVSNGFRSIAHDTNMQEFLLKFGFRRVYCDLRVVYRPALGSCVKCLYPLKSVVDRIPDIHLTSRVKALLSQEKIRRSFL